MECANCRNDAATIKIGNDMLCTKCADILATWFKSAKWRDVHLAERRRDVALMKADKKDGKHEHP